eukprot:g1001.t1
MIGVDLFAVLAMLLQQSINGAYTVLAASVLSSKDPAKKIGPGMFALIRDGGAIAIKNIGAVIFAVMQPAQPVLTLIIAVAIGMEKLKLCGTWSETYTSWAKVIGMVITVTGAVLTLLLQPHKKSSGGGSLFFGSVILMLEVCMGALYGIFQKGVLKEYHSLVVTAWGYSFGLLLILMTVVPSLGQGEQYTCSKYIPSQDICHDTSQFDQHKLQQLCDWVHPGEMNVDKASGCQVEMSFFHVPMVAAVPLVYSIVLNSATGYYLMAWVNNRTSPFFVTMFYPVQMIVSALLDWMFYSHKSREAAAEAADAEGDVEEDGDDEYGYKKRLITVEE